jgi:hypothetical protein
MCNIPVDAMLGEGCQVKTHSMVDALSLENNF